MFQTWLTHLEPLLERFSSWLQRFLLGSAVGVFVISVGLLLWNGLIGLPDWLVRFAPSSILGVLTAALTVVLLYETLQLALALRHSLVRFTRVLFEVVSLVVVRELFKRLDGMMVNAPIQPQDLLEIVLVMAGSLVLYFLIELIERLQRRYTKRVDAEPTRLKRAKVVLSSLAVIGLAGLMTINVVAWLSGLPGAGFDKDFLHTVFAVLVGASAALLLASILFVHTYETVFEYSALMLSAVICLLALELPPLLKMPMVISAALFSIGTLYLHGFARGDKL